MAFEFADHALVESETLSRFIWGVDDATGDLSPALSDAVVANVQFAINAISKQIMRHVSSNIKQANYVEAWDGAASDELVPTEFPITAVSDMRFSQIGEFDGAQNIYALSGNPVCFDKYSIKLRGFRTPAGRNAVRVSYTAGYAEIPEDIQLAVCLQFQWLYAKLGKTGDGMAGISSITKTIGGASEGMTKDSTLKKGGLISEVVGMLEGYMRLEAPLSIMFTRVS